MNVIDLFSGAGGLSYGFEKAGYDVLLGVDHDEKALETFKFNHKDSKILCDDLRNVTSSDIFDAIGKKTIDVIVGGPPCQGMSISGPRKFDDPRNELYLSFIRLVEEIKPKAVIIENVMGIVSLFKGAIKDNILKRLTDMGYCMTYKLLLSSDFGVPQNRKRVFFVGLLNSDTEYTFPQKEDKIVTCEMAISDLKPLVDNLGTNEEDDYFRESQNYYQNKKQL